MNLTPIVSIITPSHNSANFIEETINSVLAQTFILWELIIVDDLSSDNSTNIVKSIINNNPDRNIYLIENKSNLGPALTRNRAIKEARGRYIAFLDSDDLWHPTKLEKQLDFMKNNNYPFTCTHFNQINEEGEYQGVVNNIPNKISYNSLLKANKVGCLTSVYDSDFFGKVYMDAISKRQDYGLWLKLLKKTDHVYCLQEILADYRVRKNSVSSNKTKLIKYHWLIYYKYEKLGFFKSLYLTFSYVFRIVFKK
ncbi:glycosyltransferase family 2 protein [Tenacibaculum geojense]|uniref:Glycosyltransferase family 2 protein n=1 Tax=Tenacibaculum geojense TaxID=915352 RepID=A0ABW3JXM4_9FLAO